VKLAGLKTSNSDSSPAVWPPWDVAVEVGSGAVDCGAADAGPADDGAADDGAAGAVESDAVADGPTTLPQAELDRTHSDIAAAEMIRRPGMTASLH
jgi:hypothetical protein